MTRDFHSQREFSSGWIETMDKKWVFYDNPKKKKITSLRIWQHQKGVEIISNYSLIMYTISKDNKNKITTTF